jgi:1-acyl-sn-glycerol-3-phosphate acyltransferase
MARWYQDLVWFVGRIFYVPSLKSFYSPEKIEYQPEPDPPFVLLANHAHRTDPFIIGMFMKKTVNYMANIEGVDPLRRALSDFVGAFPKVKGVQDMSALRQTFDLIKTGNVVGIFPEGDRSWDGETDGFQDGIAALVKKLKVPLRIVKLTGNYLSLPRWTTVKRRGKIFCEFSTLLPEEFLGIDNETLTARLQEMMYRNDLKDERLKDVEFTCEEPASGVHFLLWLCPKCGSRDTLTGEGDRIICSECDSRWNLDAKLRVSPEIPDVGIDLKDWSDWQRRRIKGFCADALRSDEPLISVPGIEMGKVEAEGLDSYGEGDLLLFGDRVEFRSAHGGISSPVARDWTVRVEDLFSYVDNFNESFQFAVGRERYKVFFRGRNAAKWIFFLRRLQGKETLEP